MCWDWQPQQTPQGRTPREVYEQRRGSAFQCFDERSVMQNAHLLKRALDLQRWCLSECSGKPRKGCTPCGMTALEQGRATGVVLWQLGVADTELGSVASLCHEKQLDRGPKWALEIDEQSWNSMAFDWELMQGRRRGLLWRRREHGVWQGYLSGLAVYSWAADKNKAREVGHLRRVGSAENLSP